MIQKSYICLKEIYCDNMVVEMCFPAPTILAEIQQNQQWLFHIGD